MAQVKIYSSDYCPYCMRAKALLRERGVQQWEEIVVDGKPDVRSAMKDLTGRCDDLHALDARGGLVPLLST
jgi:glutaredoxin 3